MALCLVSLGSNQGDRAELLRQAVQALSRLPESRLVAQSSLIRTSPIGGPQGQSEFLNGAVLVETNLSPEALLAAAQRIEHDLGRVRGPRWGARSIDLDLLLYDELRRETPSLTLPHPRLPFRRFVLAPAVEIAPKLRHPELGWTVAELWSYLDQVPHYFALAGGTAVARKEIATQVARLAPASLLLATEIDLVSGPNSSPAFNAAISDFWWDELVARQVGKSDAASPHLVPKVLVRLGGPTDDLSQGIPFAKPQLRLATADVPAAVEEVTAAMQAMVPQNPP